MLEYVILGFLTYGDLTGYEIKKWMSQSTANFVNASFGSIYPALKRMEKKRWITVYEDTQGKRIIKKYQLRSDGKETFMEWLRAPVEVSPFHYELLAKMFFYRYLNQEEIVVQVQDVIGQLKEKIQGLQEIRTVPCAVKEVPTAGTGSGFSFEYYTLEFGVSHYQHTLEWMKAFLKKVECGSYHE